MSNAKSIDKSTTLLHAITHQDFPSAKNRVIRTAPLGRRVYNCSSISVLPLPLKTTVAVKQVMGLPSLV